MKPSNFNSLTLAIINSNELLEQHTQLELYSAFTNFLIAHSSDSAIFSKYINDGPNKPEISVSEWLDYFNAIYKDVDNISFTNHYNEIFVVDGPIDVIHPWYWIIHVIANMRHDKSTINTNDHTKWKCKLHLKSGDTLTALYHGYVINSVVNDVVEVLKDSVFNRFYSNLYLKTLQRTMNSKDFNDIPADAYHCNLIKFSEQLREVISTDDTSYYLDVFKQIHNLLTNVSTEITLTVRGVDKFTAIGGIIDNKTMVISINDLYHRPKLREIYFKNGEFNPVGIIKNTKRIIDESLRQINISDFKY